jgi:hypothetical protein
MSVAIDDLGHHVANLLQLLAQVLMNAAQRVAAPGRRSCPDRSSSAVPSSADIFGYAARTSTSVACLSSPSPLETPRGRRLTQAR